MISEYRKDYVAPIVEAVDVRVEQGFATSSELDSEFNFDSLGEEIPW